MHSFLKKWKKKIKADLIFHHYTCTKSLQKKQKWRKKIEQRKTRASVSTFEYLKWETILHSWKLKHSHRSLANLFNRSRRCGMRLLILGPLLFFLRKIFLHLQLLLPPPSVILAHNFLQAKLIINDFVFALFNQCICES